MSLRSVPAALIAVLVSVSAGLSQETRSENESRPIQRIEDSREPGAGFERRVSGDGLEIGIWYPASGPSSPQTLGLITQDVVATGRPSPGLHPLIVMSHGTGGDFTNHGDTAVALARAGFVVAAMTQPGDNWHDPSRATRIEERPKTLSRLIDYMLVDWPGHTGVDPERIGAFGFSSGGFTVLAAAGGRPDLTRVAEHCAAHPAFFDCGLIHAEPVAAIEQWPDLHDRRIKAAVVAAPALGFTFDRSGAAAIRIPVQLWRADDDDILPAPFYADAVRAALPIPPAFHGVPGAGHFDFLAPCTDPQIMPRICGSRRGFDRTAFHRTFNAEVIRFLRAAIGR